MLIYDPERQQLAGFEFRRELRLAPPAVPPGEAACHADDLEAAVAEVVSLLRVERENAVGKRLVRGDERGDLPQAEHLGGRQPVTAVRSPEPPVLAAHDDQRIEEGRGLVNLLGQALGMRGGQVALKRCWLHRLEREGREHQRATAKRLVVRADGGSAGRAHQRGEVRDFGTLHRDRHLCGVEPTGCAARSEFAAGALAPSACARAFLSGCHGTLRCRLRPAQ